MCVCLIALVCSRLTADSHRASWVGPNVVASCWHRGWVQSYPYAALSPTFSLSPFSIRLSLSLFPLNLASAAAAFGRLDRCSLVGSIAASSVASIHPCSLYSMHFINKFDDAPKREET